MRITRIYVEVTGVGDDGVERVLYARLVQNPDADMRLADIIGGDEPPELPTASE